MTVGELRIGNVIGWRSGTGEPTIGMAYEIHQDKVAISKKTKYTNDEGEVSSGQGFMHITAIEPIPLTEERLLMLGFIKTISGFELYQFPFSLEDSADGFELSAEFYGGAVLSAPCKYVHSLQNLYFALTGKELTYTPSPSPQR